MIFPITQEFHQDSNKHGFASFRPKLFPDQFPAGLKYKSPCTTILLDKINAAHNFERRRPGQFVERRRPGKSFERRRPGNLFERRRPGKFFERRRPAKFPESWSWDNSLNNHLNNYFAPRRNNYSSRE